MEDLGRDSGTETLLDPLLNSVSEVAVQVVLGVRGSLGHLGTYLLHARLQLRAVAVNVFLIPATLNSQDVGGLPEERWLHFACC